ncbi:hypothetical protein E2C01_090465 [Portunus trituberculatus]|uniref:Uncharacterized protein n=1 Tax=Portunus trituberculatus TaxID=210409 RepID=A0A5B7JLG2_PORTR|nr:hypothetical protein [Portunus trituberculatus]
MGKDDFLRWNKCLKAQGDEREKMPDTFTCPRTISDGERFKCLAQKNHGSWNDPRLSARNATIVLKRSPYDKG